MNVTRTLEVHSMDERHLLLLGLLLNQSQHGYSINEFIEKNLGHVSGMKRATAYALLEKLETKGLVQMETETSANYPPRKVYTITPAGRAAFFALLQQYLLATGEGSSATDIALMFADRLEHDRAEALLRERAARLRERIKELGSTPAHACSRRRPRRTTQTRAAQGGGRVDSRRTAPQGRWAGRCDARQPAYGCDRRDI